MSRILDASLGEEMAFGTDVVGIRKTFLRRKVESPTPNTKVCYLDTPIKKYSAEASIDRKFPVTIMQYL